MKHTALLLLASFLFNLPTGYSFNSTIDTTTNSSFFDLVSSNENVVFHLTESIKTIKKNFKKKKETKGTVSVTLGGEQLSFAAQFEPGGKSRRKICDNPPIKIDLVKSELVNHNLNKKCDKIKLVFQCSSSKRRVESIKMENFIYDLYALVTPYGRRAKMVKVLLADKDKEYAAMLLEDDKDMDVRLQLTRIKVGTIATTVVNREEYAKMCLFQYMISNADWSARRGHNTEIYKRNSDNSLIIVPYDFDYAGIINNDYAVPPENLPISDVTDRYFMDKDMGMAELKVAIDYFLGIEQDIYDLCGNVEYLSSGSKKSMAKFIKGFYDTIKNEKKVKRMLKK